MKCLLFWASFSMRENTHKHVVLSWLYQIEKHGREQPADSGDNSNVFELSPTELGQELEKENLRC